MATWELEQEMKALEKELAELKAKYEALEELYRYRCERHEELIQLVGELTDYYFKTYYTTPFLADNGKSINELHKRMEKLKQAVEGGDGK